MSCNFGYVFDCSQQFLHSNRINIDVCVGCVSTFRFEGVPLVTPNGDVLIKELNFEVSFAAGCWCRL